MNNYHRLHRIGEGSFGRVYKGRRKCTGQTVAMKFISKQKKTEKDLRNLRQEISILRDLNHENIIRMFDYFETEREFCVVTEFAQGELFEILEDDGSLPEVEIQRIAKQMVNALEYQRPDYTPTCGDTYHLPDQMWSIMFAETLASPRL